MAVEEKFKMNMYQVLSVLFLVGIYVFWFSVVATGSDILKGSVNINIFSLPVDFDKMTSFFMFLSLVTMFIPMYVLGIFNEESDINLTDSDKTLSKLDKWMGIKLNKNYSIKELGEARFKSAYISLYVLVGFSVLTTVFLIVTSGANDFTISMIISVVIYGIFVFVFQKNKDAFMLGLLALLMLFDKVITMFQSHRIGGGMSIVLSILLIAVAYQAFRANKIIKVDLNRTKTISRAVFAIITLVVIAGAIFL